MKATASRSRAVALVVVLAFASLSKADFTGPYALTPPPPGPYYTGAGFLPVYGTWMAISANAGVNTQDSPTRLQLDVPSGSIFANLLRFQTYAAGEGTISFDCSTVSRAGLEGGHIRWFRQPTGENSTFVVLDQGVDGQLRHFDFQVQAGDLFGFWLSSGSDAIGPGEPFVHNLIVQNFLALIPEPGMSAMIAAGCFLIVARFWYCDTCSGGGTRSRCDSRAIRAIRANSWTNPQVCAPYRMRQGVLRIEFPRVPISEESPAEVATFGESRTNQPFAADRIIGVNPLWQCLIAATYGHWQSTEIAYDPTARKFSTPQILGVCASCHSRRAELTGDFVPGDTYADH